MNTIEKRLLQRIADNCGICVGDIKVNNDKFTVFDRTYRYNADEGVRLITDEDNPEFTETDDIVVRTISDYEVKNYMIEEFYNDLRKTYNTVKLIIAAKSLSIEMEKGDGEYDASYDIPLLVINAVKAESKVQFPVVSVRIRTTETTEEELAIVMQTNGLTKTITDIDEDLHTAAEAVEHFTELYLNDNPDDVFIYKWIDITFNS